MSGTAECPTCGAPVGVGARFCATCGTPLAEAAPEERKLATILFADVIGSTDLGEQLDPERLRALLQDYFSVMAAVIDTWGGTIEKYIGDAILAVWGVPAAREDDPVRALHAAREMLAELERINPELERRHGVRLGVRIGVNTGEVLAPVGAQPAGQFLVSGDAVNVAARLQQSAESGTVLVGERTAASARGAFLFDDPIELTVRGKRAPVVARRLGDPTGTEAGAGGARPLQAPMLGRDRELSTLLGLLDEVIEEGAPRLVLVSGPAGMGKSRMLREFITVAAERRPELVVLRGRCLATGHGITFWALGEVLRQLCSISLDEPADSAADKLERHVAGPLAQIGLSADEIGRSAAALATSANLPVIRNPLNDLDPEQIAEEMAQAWPRLLSGLARSQPITLVIEDIHWADEPMLRMVEALATRARGPVLIIATARPEFREAHAGFGTAADLSVVSLRALTEAQSAQLVGELLGSAQLPPALIEDIQHKADGNPFFLEEIIQRLIEEGALTMLDGKWQATERAAAVQLPDTIYALLAARIDALPADEKRLLQEAAVVGRVFWPGALGAGIASEDVLRRAERRGLISLRATSTIANEPEFIFRHVLIRDVAYNSVPRKRRALAHAETGRWLEELAGERLEELGELLAYHYSAAVTGADADLGWAGNADGREAARRRAFEMLVRAGSSARRRFVVDKAAELHGQALEVADTDAERARVHEELGDDHEALFHGDDAIRQYLAAIDLVGQPTTPGHRVSESGPGDADVELKGRLATKAGRMVLRWGTFQEKPPIDRVQDIVSGALALPLDERAQAALLMVHGGLLPGPTGVPIAAGRVPIGPELRPLLRERIASIEQGMAIARRLDDPELMYFGDDMLSMAYQSIGDYGALHASAREMADLVGRLKSAREQADALVTVSSASADMGAYAEALELAADGVRRAAGLSLHEQMHISFELVAAAEALGEWQRIVEITPWFVASSAAEAAITCSAVRAGPALCGLTLARRGEAERAMLIVGPPMEPMGETFLTAAVFAQYGSYLADDSLARAAARRALGMGEAAFFELGICALIDALERLDMADELRDFLPAAETRLDAVVRIGPTIARARAWLAHRQGDEAAARRHLNAALGRFVELGIPFEIGRSAERLARLSPNPERAELLRRALDTYESVGAQPYAQRVRDTLELRREPLAG